MKERTEKDARDVVDMLIDNASPFHSGKDQVFPLVFCAYETDRRSRPKYVGVDRGPAEFWWRQGLNVVVYVFAGDAIVRNVQAIDKLTNDMRNKVDAAIEGMGSCFALAYPRAVVAQPGQRVVFDNCLKPCTPELEHDLGLTMGGVYTVAKTHKDPKFGIRLHLDGLQCRHYDASLFSIQQ